MAPRKKASPGDVLSGITVLELGSFITGPYAGLLLADLGAEVIKIEPPEGDPFRNFGEGKYSPNFVAYNRNKRSVVLDLKSEEGRESLRQLVARADVLIENYRPGVLDRLKLGYAQLKKIAPSLIFCSISGFNPKGASRDRPAFDLIGQSLSGMLNLMSDPENPVVRGPTISDQLAGFYACYGILGALVARQATGKGRKVEVNMVEASMSFMPDVFASFTRQNVVMNSRTRAAYSQANAFVCSDGKAIGVQLSSPEKFWLGLVDAVEQPSLKTDERFKNRMSRIKNFEVLTSLLRDIFRSKPRDHWMKRLEAANVPHAPVHGIDEVMTDPEVVEMGSFYDIEHPEMGTVKCLHRPVLFDGARNPSRYAPPTLGEHTREIVSGLKSVKGKKKPRPAAG